jgi:hypothetical protein
MNSLGRLKAQCLLSLLELGLKINVSYMYAIRFQEKRLINLRGSVSDRESSAVFVS